MINNSDAFIGIYPFSDDTSIIPTKEKLLNASEYFRLECDLAVRAQIPCMVLHDQRFGDLFNLPRHVRQESFDYQEVTGSGGSPMRRRFERLFETFQSEVSTAIELSSISDLRYSESSVGIIVPYSKTSSQNYTDNDLDIIQQTVRNKGFDSVQVIPWPPVFDQKLSAVIESLDFVVVDIGNEAMSSGIIGFLHGRCVPCIRLLKGYITRNILTKRVCLRGMFGFVPVGYVKDIILWKDRKNLLMSWI